MFVARAAGSTVAGSIVASAATTGPSASSITVTKPTGTATGDMMIALMADDAGSASNMTSPAGWTLLTSASTGSGNYVKVWTKQAGASEPSSYSFNTDSLGDSVASITTLRNVTSSTGSWLYAAPSLVTQGNSLTCPTVSGAAAGAILLCNVTADAVSAASWTAPSGMTMQVQAQNGGTPTTTSAVAALLAPANPTGTKTFTTSSNWSSNKATVWSVVIPHA